MAITTNDKNLGHATAYAYAKSKGYTGTEEEFAELMASYATVAEEAEASRQAAEVAHGKAEDAQDAAETAQAGAESARNTAVSAKDTAVSSASTATTKAGEASASASSAAGSATSAAGSATSAASSATAASGSATTASTKASEAAASATAAQTAKTGAETAQTAAETAQEAAENAAESVSESAAQIATNTQDISDLKSALTQIETAHVSCESGAYGSSGTNKVSANNFIRNKMPINVKNLYSITIPDGYEANLIFLNANIVKIGEATGYLRDIVTSSEFLANTYYVNLAIRNISTPSTDISSQVSTVENGLVLMTNSEKNTDNVTNIINRLYDLDGRVFIDPTDYEIGGIDFTDSGWTYYDNSKRIRTKSGTMYNLKAGSIIGLASYTNARFYISALLSDGSTYWKKGWNTADVSVPFDGSYVITVSNITEVTLNSKYDLLDLVFIDNSDNVKTKESQISEALSLKMPLLLEVGNISISTNGWIYSFDRRRARTPFGTALHLYPGDKITLSDYTMYYFYLGWKTVNGTYKYKSWTSEDYYVTEEGDYVILIATKADTEPASMKAMMDALSVYHSYGAEDIIRAMEQSEQHESTIKSVNHRGYNLVAPENTLPAYELSKQHGYLYVETDISFTSDGIAVLLHDETINRTARNSDGTEITNTININDITYEQLQTYDFGIWKGAAYAGTKIPTLAQFFALCRKLGLRPYVELKTTGAYTQEQITGVVTLAQSYGLKDVVTWISFYKPYLEYVKAAYPRARLGFLCGTEITSEIVANATALKTSENDVFIDATYYYITSESVALAITAGLPVEVWSLDHIDIIAALNPYVTGITSDELIAEIVIRQT